MPDPILPQDDENSDDAAAAVYRAAFAKTRRTPPPPLDRARLSAQARGPRGESIRAHLWTIAILGVTLAALTWFLFGYIPSEGGLAGFGVGLMIGALVGRILMEVVSLVMLLSIDFSASSAAFLDANRRFLKYRRWAHQHLAVNLLIGYGVGYYVLLYVFRDVPTTAVLVLMAVSFPVIMSAVYFLSIRPGQRREREALEEWEALMEGTSAR